MNQNNRLTGDYSQGNFVIKLTCIPVAQELHKEGRQKIQREQLLLFFRIITEESIYRIVRIDSFCYGSCTLLITNRCFKNAIEYSLDQLPGGLLKQK